MKNIDHFSFMNYNGSVVWF